MADRFDVMTVWIENVGRKIIRVMFETQARCAIITATGGNRRFVKCLDLGPAWYARRHMKRRSNHRPLHDEKLKVFPTEANSLCLGRITNLRSTCTKRGVIGKKRKTAKC